jgi:hypothetical protein
MGNMSYCRFENTERDLEDCLNVINEGGDELSRREYGSALKIMRMILEIADEYNDVNGDLSDDGIEEFLEDKGVTKD